MAVVATPIFAQSLLLGAVSIATANTNRDGTGTIATVCTGDGDGSFVDHIDITAAGTTTAGVVRLFLHDGTNFFLWKEVLVPAITPSASIAVFMRSIDCSLPGSGLSLPSASYTLRASTHNAETFKVAAFGGNY